MAVNSECSAVYWVSCDFEGCEEWDGDDHNTRAAAENHATDHLGYVYRGGKWLCPEHSAPTPGKDAG